jgi:hypothetical protein
MRCAECGAEADDRTRGWRVMLGEEWETDGSLFVVIYCPDCFAREFEQVEERGSAGEAGSCSATVGLPGS